MVAIALSLLAIFVLLLIGEWLWRSKRLRGELGRKFVHISVGVFVSSWAFYMSFHSVQLIALAFLVVVLASRQLKLFRAVHTIDRKSYGEVMFALGIGLSAFITHSAWIFAAAILHLGLADGLAALAGKRYGKTNEYKILGFTKSIAGTVSFWLASVFILIFVVGYGTRGSSLALTLPLLIWLPITASVAENIGLYGLDNIFVPLLVSLALGQLSFVR